MTNDESDFQVNVLRMLIEQNAILKTVTDTLPTAQVAIEKQKIARENNQEDGLHDELFSQS